MWTEIWATVELFFSILGALVIIAGFGALITAPFRSGDSWSCSGGGVHYGLEGRVTKKYGVVMVETRSSRPSWS
jgi:hypothetical protein